MAAEVNESLESIIKIFLEKHKDSKTKCTDEIENETIQVQLEYYPGRNPKNPFHRYNRMNGLSDKNVLVITHIYIERSADRSTERPEEHKNLVEKSAIEVLKKLDIDAIVIESIINDKWFEHLTGTNGIKRWTPVNNSVYLTKDSVGGRKSKRRNYVSPKIKKHKTYYG